MTFEMALEEICDSYCKKPIEITNQEELDEVCDNCPMVRFFEENHGKVLKLED